MMILDPLFENQNDEDDEFEIEENDVEENLIDDKEEVPEQEEKLIPQWNKKLLTKNWLVHDIDSGLDKNNYDPIHCINGNGHWQTLTGCLGPKTHTKQKR